MRTVPTIGCAGKDGHDYQFQYAYPQSLGHGLPGPSTPPDRVIGMCRSCGDVYMVEVPSHALNTPSRQQDTLFGSGEIQSTRSIATEGPFFGGVSISRDRDDGPTNSVPTPRPSNW